MPYVVFYFMYMYIKMLLGIYVVTIPKINTCMVLFMIYIIHCVTVLDSSGKLIFKEPMYQNRTVKIELDMMEHKCLEIAVSKDECLWQYRLGHLTFKYISNLKRRNMVSGLPKIEIPNEVCEEHVQAK